MGEKKKISLEEARKSGDLDKFAEQHPSVGSEEMFDDLLGAMVKKKKVKDQASHSDASED